MISPDQTFQTEVDSTVPFSTLVSDDFSSTELDPAVWAFTDPTADTIFTMTGNQVLLTPSASATHDVWTNGNYLPRVMQASEDTDFEIEVKFESALSEGIQTQGLLIEEDSEFV